MNPKSPSFDQSLELDAVSKEDLEIKSRRLQTYSVDALRKANAVERVFVNHPQFVQALKVLDRLFQLGTEMETPQGLRLVGPPGVGKTAVFSYFQNSLPASSLFEKSLGVIGMRVPLRPYSGQLVRAFLQVLQYPFSSGTNRQLYERRRVVFDAIKARGTRMVWLDEAQHLIHRNASGAFRGAESDAAEFLRELMDECRLSLVFAGSKELDDLPAALPHLASRVAGRETLDEFSLNAHWAGFVKAFLRQVTDLDTAPLEDSGVMTQLHKATGGNPRLFKQLMVEAVLIAIDSCRVELDRDLLSSAYSVAFGTAASRSNPFV